MAISDKSLWLGSCFTENMGPWLADLGYPVLSNPFGVVYHPLMMEKLLAGNQADFFRYNFEREGVWHNFLLGAPFLAADENALKQQISEASERCRLALEKTDWLVLTFGTAFLYHHQEMGAVGKCHRMPSGLFEKKLSSVDEIVSQWKLLIENLRRTNPGLRVLLSLSPVRHSRDGMEENAVSKSILRLAIFELCRQLPSIFYFPAFELMNDELRDYRFYAADLVHPSAEAVEYLRRQFEMRFLRSEDAPLRRLAEEILRLEKHRPQAPWSVEAIRWREFLDEKKRQYSDLMGKAD
jgi:hypothetical protein